MKSFKPAGTGSKLSRRGFTLVELMVVVAIMAVLAALVAGVVIKATEAQRNSNTLTTMEVIKSSLSKQLQAVIDDGKKKGDITKAVTDAFPVSLASAGTPNYTKYRANPSTNPTGVDPNAYLLRMILEAGPFGKLDTDMLPKGALSADKPILLDAWGDPISLQISTANNKIKFTLKSPNVSEAISN
jgi:prepilin-type N-terminal cleavage/methylation domain-containing protein